MRSIVHIVHLRLSPHFHMDSVVFQTVFWLKAGVELHVVVVVATAVSNPADRSLGPRGEGRE